VGIPSIMPQSTKREALASDNTLPIISTLSYQIELDQVFRAYRAVGAPKSIDGKTRGRVNCGGSIFEQVC